MRNSVFAPMLTVALPSGVIGQTLAIRAENILPISSAPIRNGIVLVKDGKILKVGVGIPIPPGASVLRAHTVMPGLIDAHSSLGVHGELAESADSLTSELKAADAFDRTDRNLNRALRSGVTTAAVMPPNTNVIGGQPAIVRLGRSPTIVKESAGLKISISPESISQQRNPTSRAGIADLLNRTFSAAASGRPVSAATQTSLLAGGVPSSFSARVSPVSEVINGRGRAFVYAPSHADVELCLEILRGYPGMRLALINPVVAEALSSTLRSRRIPVTLGPFRFIDSDLVLSAAGRLARAGVPVSFCTNAPPRDPASLRLSAHLAVKFGMPREAALRGLTLTAAEFLGISEQSGSISAGKNADILLLDGDPLNLTSRVQSVIVGGRVEYQESK